jgi:hypothetical protein
MVENRVGTTRMTAVRMTQDKAFCPARIHYWQWGRKRSIYQWNWGQWGTTHSAKGQTLKQTRCDP